MVRRPDVQQVDHQGTEQNSRDVLQERRPRGTGCPCRLAQQMVAPRTAPLAAMASNRSQVRSVNGVATERRDLRVDRRSPTRSLTGPPVPEVSASTTYAARSLPGGRPIARVHPEPVLIT